MTTPMAAAVRATLDQAMRQDDAVVLLGEATGRMGGLWGTSAGLLDAFGPDRVRDLPIADRAMVGLALGLALGGRKPVVELASTHRLAAIAEVLADAAAASRAGEFPVPLVVRVPYGSHAGDRIDTPIGQMAVPAGLRVVCARSAIAAAALLRDALSAAGPTVILEPRSLARAAGPSAPLGRHAVDRIVEGHHGTLVAWGDQVGDALAVAETLAGDGLSFEVIDLVTLAPLDRAALGARLRQTGRLCVLHPRDPDLADHVVQAVVDTAFLYLEAPPARATTAPELLRAARDAATW